jgi:hypothetical protein
MAEHGTSLVSAGVITELLQIVLKRSRMRMAM